MTKEINGEIYYYIGTTYDEDLIYDMYENDRDVVIYEVVGSMY